MCSFQCLSETFLIFKKLLLCFFAFSNIVDNRVKQGFMLNGNGSRIDFNIVDRTVSKTMAKEKVIAFFSGCLLHFSLNFII